MLLPAMVGVVVLAPWTLDAARTELQAPPTESGASVTGQGTAPASETPAPLPPADAVPDAPAPEAAPPDADMPRVVETLIRNRPDEVASVTNARGTVTFFPGVQVRNQVGYVSPFLLDGQGERYAEGAQATGRIRWSPVLRLGREQRVELVGQLDIANGRWTTAGSADPVIDEIISPPGGSVAIGQPPGRQSTRWVDPRHLYLRWTTRVGQLQVGQMGFTWGQGILANDGNNVDRFGDLRFGDDGPGDIYERILFGTRPFKPLGGIGGDFIVALGADMVFRDERVDLVASRGEDLAAQGIFVLRWQPENQEENYLGAYAVYRWQDTRDDGDVYADDEQLEVGAGDVAGQGVFHLRPGLQFIAGFEGAIIGGRTTVAWTGERQRHRVLQGGFAARAYIGDHERWLAGLDLGYASGDQNPSDGQINNFTFDAGHTVGLVLFQSVQGWRTARSEILATNGELTGEPLNGTQFIPTRGGVTNAAYFHPKARYSFKEMFEVWGGPLFAFAPVDITDPYATRLAGGTGTNSVGGDGSNRFYGSELDLGLRARYDFRGAWFQVGLQGGLLIPGLGLADAAGDRGPVVAAAQLRTEIRY